MRIAVALLLGTVVAWPNLLAQDPAALVQRIERAADVGPLDGVRREWAARAAARPDAREPRLALATIARINVDYGTADSLYRSLLPPAGARPDRLQLWARLGLGHSLGARWITAPADSLLTQAITEATALGDRRAELGALVRLSMLRSRTAGVPAGLALLDRAERLVARTDTIGRLQILTSRAQLFLARGDTGAARLAEQTRRLARQAKLKRAEALALQILAREQLRVGRSDSAIVLFGRSATLLEPLREWVGLAVALQWRGFLLRMNGNLGAARRDLERVLEIGDAAGALTLGWVQLNLGEIALSLADWRGANEYFTRARSRMAEVGDQWGLASAARSDAAARRATRDWGAADSLLDAAERLLVQSGNRSEIQVMRLERLRNALARREWDTARRMLTLVRDTAATRTAFGVFDVDYFEALLALGQGNAQEAIRVLGRSTSSEQGQAYLRRARLAEAHARLGHADSAASLARNALQGLEDWRSSQRTRETRLAAFRLFGDYGDPDVGFATIIASMVSAGHLEAAFEIAERLASRELMDAMVRRDALRIDAAESRTLRANLGSARAPVMALRELEQSLPESTAVIQYVTGAWEEPTTAFIVARGHSRALALPTVESLLGAINGFKASLQTGVLPRPLARRLGDALLAPVAAQLPPNVSKLIVVGGTVLQALPFDALELTDGRLAIERFEIAFMPSASISALLARRGGTSRGGILALGASIRPRGLGRASWESLPELPGAAREARRVASFFSRGQAKVGSEATESLVKGSVARSASVVHVASHAVVDPSAMGETALLLAAGAGEDGILRPEEIGDLSLGADLVVLSACRTTRTEVGYGDEGFRGLVTPLFEAGVRSVVATAWPVDDTRQMPIVERFYREMARGATVAGALRTAKLAALHSGSSPREWASMVLWGDPRARPTAFRNGAS
jgi:tetratricopeptide (TPR) repeat protein